MFVSIFLYHSLSLSLSLSLSRVLVKTDRILSTPLLPPQVRSGGSVLSNSESAEREKSLISNICARIGQFSADSGDSKGTASEVTE